jgi:hypothetical protein
MEARQLPRRPLHRRSRNLHHPRRHRRIVMRQMLIQRKSHNALS